MGGGGSVLFNNVRDFGARLPGRPQLVTADGTPFRARLTWLELRGLQLVHARETVPRIGYLAFPDDWVTAVFPIGRRSTLACDGAGIQGREIALFHGGASTHQRTLGPTKWSLVSLETSALRDFGMLLTGRNFTDSPATVLRPAAADWRQLSKLHSEAIRIAETRLAHIYHPQVARALEQELIWSLVSCLSNAQMMRQSAGTDRNNVLARFEACLVRHPGELLSISAICKSIHASEQTLRALCSRVLGMSPSRYQRLRAHSLSG